MKPKKLIREKITSKLKEGEFENITDQVELNKLYAIKVREELAEIQESDHKDIFEFVDLIQVAVCFAEQNGFSQEQIELSANIKYVEKGKFSNLVLNNLNHENPSNKLYFEKTKNELQQSCITAVISRFFLRQYYKLFFYEGRENNRSKGKFKVLYNDGRYSENMCYKVAKDYASIFGGKVMDAF